MPIAYYGSSISPHIDKSPEGYLICRDVPINRTGEQDYLARELGLDGDPERVVKVYRLPEDVFAPAALASFEGKDVTNSHPPEMLTAENQAAYSKGHLEHVRRVGDNTVADLFIKDPVLVSQVESGAMREVSCGYNCNFEPYLDGYKQTRIRGNHLAIVPRGRAGGSVSIHDAAAKAEKGTNMNKLVHGILTAFGMAAKDASPEDIQAMANVAGETIQAVEDAEPVSMAQDAEPMAEEPPAPAAKDEMVETAPKGDDLGAKLDRILAMLEAKSRGGHGEHPLHDEGDIDAEIKRLLGAEEDGKSITIPVENNDACAAGPARDAAVELLRRVRPAVSEIKDPGEKARVTDALLSAVRGKDNMAEIARAATDAAKVNAAQTSQTTYDKICADSEAAYAARNPHKKEG